MAEVKPGLVVLPGRLAASIEEGSYVVMSGRSFNVVFDDINLRVISSVARGVNRFNELLKETQAPRGQLSRHLRALVKNGWLTKGPNGYSFSASIYVVAEVEESSDTLLIRLEPTKGAFIDPIHGLVIFSGTEARDYCSTCPLRTLCTRNVKEMASKYGLKLHYAEPAEAYMEVFRGLVLMNLVKRLRSSYLNLKVVNKG